MAPRQRRHGQGYAWACWRRLHASVPSSMLAVVCLDITRGGSLIRRLAWLMKHPYRAFNDSVAMCGGCVFAPHWEPGSCPHQGACRSSMYAEKPSPPFLLAGRSACTSLSCRESWRGTAGLGLLAATVQHKQFPRRRGRLPRETNCVCFPVLHVVTAAGAVRPAHHRRPDHNKDALARP